MIRYDDTVTWERSGELPDVEVPAYVYTTRAGTTSATAGWRFTLGATMLCPFIPEHVDLTSDRIVWHGVRFRLNGQVMPNVTKHGKVHHYEVALEAMT